MPLFVNPLVNNQTANATLMGNLTIGDAGGSQAIYIFPSSSNTTSLSNGGNTYSAGYQVAATKQVVFSDGTDYGRGIAAVTGAAELKITDGSTGLGILLFKLPTADPTLVGALWNNAGTITISAG